MSRLTGSISTVWSIASSAARRAARAGLLKQADLGVKVISVGNLQAGGTGKTPIVARIANEAAKRGLLACILTRGYRSKWESAGGLIAPGDPAVPAAVCGDEPALLHELAPEAWIAVGADRVESFARASRRSRFDLVILDDGFQHWKIKRDVDLVAVTSAGRDEKVFRDFSSALANASIVVWTKGETRPDSAGRPMVKVKMSLARAKDSRRYWLVAGVADVSSVLDSVRNAGYSIEREIFFPDHAAYGREEVRALLDEARSSGARIVLTGKDWVKWRELGADREHVTVLEPEVIIEEGQQVWENALWGA